MSKDNDDKVDQALLKILQRKKFQEPGVITTHTGGNKTPEKKSDADRDPRQILLDLDAEVEEHNKDMPCDIFIERDEFGKVRFILKEKVKEEDLEESIGTEISELTEAFSEALFEEEGNIIRDVCLLSSISKNNRRYLDGAMNNVLALANGVKVFADHEVADGKGKVRSVRDLIGKILYPHKSGNRIFGNFEVLENHKDWVFSIAKQMPEMAGMSIVARGKIHPERDSEGREQVESVSTLKSIDLVSEPATTSGLYEQHLGIGKDGSIKSVRVGKGFDKNSPTCEFCQKVICPVYSELNTNYEECSKYKNGANCPYSPNGEFYRGK